MLSKKVSVEGARLANPADSIWSEAEIQMVDLAAVPMAVQPSVYISSTMNEQPVGKVKQVTLASLHNGEDIYFKLSWSEPAQCVAVCDTTRFPDGASVIFPLGSDAPLATMGAEGQAVNAWHWRADKPEVGVNNIASGLGTTQITDKDTILAESNYDNGSWSVVLRRPMQTGDAGTMKQFAAGASTKLACAVWSGEHGERGGLKAFSPDWLELELES